jgi:hypothetical protein
MFTPDDDDDDDGADDEWACRAYTDCGLFPDVYRFLATTKRRMTRFGQMFERVCFGDVW